MNQLGPKRPKRKYNREFQKNEVIKYLIMKDQIITFIDKPIVVPNSLFNPPYGEEIYMCYIYKVKDYKEYLEGFGPSVNIRIENEDTTWKRSRNKWNSFDKIRTSNQLNNENFEIMWDQSGMNSYYVLERMYYYLDKEKHKNKFNSIRAKLYVTRVHQNKDWIFLLQFITEHLTLEEQESSKRMKQKRKKTICNTDVIEETIKKLYVPMQNQQLLSSYAPLTNTPISSKISSTLPPIKSYKEYMDHSGVMNIPLNYQLLNTISLGIPSDRKSIYLDPLENPENLSLKRKSSSLTENEEKIIKKRKIENDKIKGKVIEDKEILKVWFNSPSNLSGLVNEGVDPIPSPIVNYSNSLPKGIFDLLN